MEIRDRLLSLIEAENLSSYKFYRISGLGNGYLDKMKDNIRRSTVRKIQKAFPHWNIQWILTGKGEKYVEVVEEKRMDPLPASPFIMDQVMNVPLINQYAYAGYLGGYADKNYMETLPAIPFVVNNEAFGNYIAFEVRGDGMNDGTEDSYLEGDKLLCLEIEPRLWAGSKLHHRKWDYIIVHTDGIFIKRIIDHDPINQTITVHSLNEAYPDRIFNLSDVRQLFHVVELQRPRRR